MFIVPLVEWLVAKGLPSWLSELIVWAVIALVATLAAIYFWESKVAHPYIKQGMEKQQKIDEPIIKQQTERADLAEKRLQTALAANKSLADSIDAPGGLRDQIKDANESIDMMAILAQKARAQAADLLAKLKVQAARDVQEIERLRAAANGPPVVELVCETASAVLSDLAAWRLAQ